MPEKRDLILIGLAVALVVVVIVLVPITPVEFVKGKTPDFL
jgi:hypothetical protein